MMYFEEEDEFYIMISDYKTSIYRFVRNYEWEPELIEGEDVYLGTLFSNYDIDDILEMLRNEFSIVELIDESEINDYI